jgi:isopenicillin N synthase-like dioxygenase
MSAFVDPPRLPVIDFAPFEAGGSWRDHVATQIDWAAGEFGFFYLVGHGVDLGAVERLAALSRAFFLQDGPDLKEGLYFGEEFTDADARVRAGTPLHGGNLFPRLPGFRDAVLDYMTELTGLGHHLMSAIGRGLRLGDHYFFDRYTGSPTRLFRIFNYPAAPRDQSDEPGVGERTDHGLLTLLYQDEAEGLQMKYDDSWIDVPYVPGSFVVNVGDMLQRITSGRYVSASKRVVNRSGRPKISMPFFFDPGFNAVLQPIPDIPPTTARRSQIDRQDGGYGECFAPMTRATAANDAIVQAKTALARSDVVNVERTPTPMIGIELPASPARR